MGLILLKVDNPSRNDFIFSDVCSDNEEICRMIYNNYLVSQNLVNVNWVLGENPPDYWLYIGNNKFAVEVTSIVDEVEGGNKILPRYEYEACARRLAENINQKAKGRGVLKGKYYIMFFGRPKYIPRRDNKVIIESAIEYISNSCNHNSYGKAEIFKESKYSNYNIIYIMKVSAAEDKVTLGSHNYMEGFETDIVHTIIGSINKRILKKKYKLSNISHSRRGDILLILNDFFELHGSTLDIFDKCYEGSNSDTFHSVVLIQKPDELIVLNNRSFD